jgi:undecaprenyl-diphosphatase
MIIFQAIILGIIEGLTEFLPVSSTGHLILAERAMGYRDTAEIFTVVVQVGAIAAVIWYYRNDLWKKFENLMGRQTSAIRFWKNWILATIPAGIVGLAVGSHLDRFATPLIVAVALIIGGILIWLVETYHDPKPAAKTAQLDEITTKQSLQVGSYQVLSLIPGVSRSGSTIMGGLMSGLDRVTATAFSFYLSLPILILASLYKIFKGRHEFNTVAGGVGALVIGTIATFIVAFFVVGWLLRYVSKHDFKPFAYYRIALGIVVIAILVLR